MNEKSNETQHLSAEPNLLEYLLKIRHGENLSFAEARGLFTAISDVDVNVETRAVQTAGLLVALEMKGVTGEELAGLAQAMRDHAVSVRTRHKTFIDTAGTGAGRVKTFNVSTAAAFVIAGAGLPVAKHGNRAVTSKSGSADVLQKLGVNIDAAPETAQTCLDGAGICFMFARKFHTSLAFIGRIRGKLGIRTVFNFLGPLSNPARAPRQIIGVSEPSKVEPMAHALTHLKTERAWVIHGADGLDELTLARESFVAEVNKGKITTFTIEPEDFGIKRASINHLTIRNADDSAQIIREVLEGKRRDEARQIVILNAAAALLVGGFAKQPLQAARLAEQSLDSDSARVKLQRLIEATNRS